MKFKYLLPCALGAACLVSYATESMSGEEGTHDDKPLHVHAYGGLVANQTMTVAGYDFYRYFVAAWNDKNGSDRYSLSVHEQPTARFGSRIWVEFSHRRVFQANLPPTRASLRPLGEQAAEAAYATVVDDEVNRALFRDPDLASDELL